ncbi:Kelch repeat-containing protein [Motilibacter aurantiacus]|uniref:Kelch repeat-containing protein n=1 Tax=Motilibacter aurantiacus TaxID=2714955 RepID=UPI0014077D2E|nr:kelch repeat-containing protein [Motilibacter aurantiacus]NHC45881.1 hypothetical protein [Motilibacter aurantiacus]
MTHSTPHLRRLAWRGPRSRLLAPVTALVAALAVLAGLSPATAGAASDVTLSYSLSPQRTGAAPLAGASLPDGNVYIFTAPSTGVREVRFYLDDPERAKAPRLVEKGAPHDFAGTARDDSALPFDTRTLPVGTHTVTAEIVPSSGAIQVLSAAFAKTSPAPALTVSPASFALAAQQGSAAQTATLSVSGPAVPFALTSSAAWLRLSTAGATAPAAVTLTADPSALPVGSATANVTVTAEGRQPVVVPVSVTVTPVSGSAASGSQVLISRNAKRTSPVALNGATVSGGVYPFLSPDAGVTSVSWYLDDPATAGAPVRVDTTSPFDYAPGSVTHAAAALDTTALADGSHTITAKVTSGSDVSTVTATFTTSNGTRALAWAAPTLALTTEAGATATVSQVQLTAPTGAAVGLASDAAWLRAPASITGSGTVAVTADPAGLAPGTHSATLRATSTGATPAVLGVTLTVRAAGPAPALIADPASLAVTAAAGSGPVTRAVALSGASAAYTAAASAPWLTVTPAAGTAPATLSVTVDPAGLPVGTSSGSVTVTAPSLPQLVIPVTVDVPAGAGDTAYSVVFSRNAKRTAPVPLAGAALTGSAVYPFLAPDTGVTSVSWYLDDPAAAREPVRVDATAPFDYAPGSVTHSAAAFDTTAIPDGTHTITAKVDSAAGTKLVAATFTTDNGTNALTWSAPSIAFATDQNGATVSGQAQLSAQQPGTAVTLASDAPWLRVAPTATAPAAVQLVADPAGLTPGHFTATVRATAPGAFDGVLTVELTVGDTGGCSPVACDLIKVDTPYNLAWRYDSGAMLDADGLGTGFTTILKKDSGNAYRRDLLDVDLETGTLNVTTTAGRPHLGDNDQDNMVGVGFDGDSEIATISATIAGMPAVTGRYEQAGVWFGYGQDNVDRMVIASTPNGLRFEHVLEVAGVEVSRKNSPITAVASDQPVQLAIRSDPTKRTVTAYYKVGDAGLTPLSTFTAPGEFFSFDAAGIDPRVGTRSFGGILATHRSAAQAVTYPFSSFSLGGEFDIASSPDYPFTRTSYDVPFPTSMAMGPDGKLYVQSMFGKIHVLTLDAQHKVVDRQIVSTLGTRMALGLTVDPASTPDNVIVWVAHSSPVVDAGEVDSGTVTRLSGPGLAERTDVITGLPRSFANHSTNSLHFGPDGRLYIAQGGNTGAGAPNTAKTEFSDRAEQPLSAALLVANVKAPGFNGRCADPSDMSRSGLGCDVKTFATGLRNTYDFVISSKGLIYGPNNGLGVVGSYPASASAPCTGMGDTRPWNQGGNNPGLQNDDLNLIEEGRYYGTPNPTRGECVFKDGSYQGVPAAANYAAPLFDLGPNRSANGIVEYRGSAFCGQLDTSLLITNYSVGDDVTLVQLSADGRSVTSAKRLVGGFKDPLPIAQGPDGTIVVGEFGGNAITILEPQDIGCWADAPALPEKLLDSGAAVIDGMMYLVGGKTDRSHSSRLYVYDDVAKAWTRKADMPGAAVENPAVTTLDGKLLVLGGSTDAFGGAQAAGWSYDPAADAWSALPAMPTARGGASAQVVEGKVYVVGGMSEDGASTGAVEVYDPASRTWSVAPSLPTARDNPGTAVLGGALYVFGGRTRLASGATSVATHTTVEAYDPATRAWTAKAAMPTGRRTMASVVVDGKALLIGGEVAPDGSAFDVVEQYDPAADAWKVLRRIPTPRHGASAAVLDGKVHVVGGGPSGGFAFTDAHEVLTLPGS